jgi:pyruvate kinase
MRHTKITCTIGPNTESAEMLEKMIRAGMNVARLNMSHGTHEWTREVFQRIRTASEKVDILARDKLINAVQMRIVD